MNSSGKWTLQDGLRTVAKKFKQKVTKPERETLYHGLINQGATCYLNSVLQVLFMTTEIHDRLDPESQITDQELRRLFKDLKETTCGTENITKTLEIRNVNQQRDAAECLELILNKLSPQASEVFQGQLTYTIKCLKGHIINEETNPFWTLPLPLKDTQDSTYSVESSFRRIFQTKTYTGDNMVYCNDCNNQADATSGCEMVEAPQILILLLKRFDFDYNTMSHFKSDCCVEVPCKLQLKTKTYKLYGMVDHMGGLRGGHYTTTILSDEDKSWYEFDNTHVSKVKRQPFVETGPYKSRTVYLLTYRAAESQMSPETNKLDDLRQDDVESKRSLVERDADDEIKGQIRQNDTVEVQETSDEALSSQTAGEESTAETGKIVLDDEVRSETEPKKESFNRENLTEEKAEIAGEPECERFGSHDKDDESDGEISHIRDMKTDENCRTASEVENSVDVEAQDNLNVDVGEESKESCEQHLDEETKTEKEEQRATESQKPVETTSEDHTVEVEEEQGEDIGSEELKGDEEPKRNTDDEETTQMGHSAEDEGQMGKDRKEERLQARGEEGDAEKVETDTSITNHTTATEVKSSEEVEAQENKGSNTRENSKSEELNETRVEDASVDVVEQPKDSCEQHLAEETKTEKEEQRATQCQKPVGTTSEDPTVELEEEQGEDIGPAKLKGDEEQQDSCEQHLDEETKTEKEEQTATECQKPVETTSEDHTDEVEEEQGEDVGPAELKGDEEPKTNTDDEETTQMGHSAEDEGQMGKDRKEERLQARGEEGDEEKVETDTSITNHTTATEVKSSEEVEAQENKGSNTRENSKSEELNETKEDASANVVEQPKDSCEQHLAEETKTEKEEQRATQCQKPVGTTSEDPTVELEEEQGEDIGPAKLKGDEEQQDSCEQHLDEETKTEKEEQTATECQKPVETTSEDHTDEVEEEQGEDIGPAELKGDEEPKTNTDDEETTQMGHSAEDEGQMGKDRKEERLQARGEEGDAVKVETDTSITNHTTATEVKSSEEVEAQENKGSNTRENSKSEELNETKEDASANVVEQPKDSCEQHLAEETKTEKEEQRATQCQKPVGTTSEDPTVELEEEQGEDIGPAKVKGDEEQQDSCEQHLDEETKTEKEEQTECQKPVETTSEDHTDEVEEEQGEDVGPAELKGDEEPKTNTDDEETTQMGHSAEDEGQMGKDSKEEGQSRGEEGDAENVETDTSITNHTTATEVKSSEEVEAQENKGSNTRENSKSEELNETRVEEASVNVVEQPKDSCEQHLAEETKTEKEEQRATQCQKPVGTTSEDPTVELEEEQGEDIGPAKVKGDEEQQDSCEQHLDEETKTEKEEQTECQKPVETTSEDHTDEVEEEQGEDVGPAELKGDKEPKRNTDDEETTEMGHSAEDEGQMGKDRKEEGQSRGEEGDAENVETDTSITNHTTATEVKSSEEVEAQENKGSNTRENSKSEELNETRVEDASVNVVEQPKDSCEQHLAEVTKTEKEEQRATDCQKPVETMKM